MLILWLYINIQSVYSRDQENGDVSSPFHPVTKAHEPIPLAVHYLLHFQPVPSHPRFRSVPHCSAHCTNDGLPVQDKDQASAKFN